MFDINKITEIHCICMVFAKKLNQKIKETAIKAPTPIVDVAKEKPKFLMLKL